MAKRSRRGSRDTIDGNSQPEQPSDDAERTGGGSADETEQPAAGGGSVIDIGAAGDDPDGNDADSSGERKRRSDAGRKRGAYKKTNKVDLGEFSEIIRELHIGLAAFTACPELELDPKEDEHKKVADALARLAEYYEITKIVGVATHPLVGVARIMWAIYIPRIIAIRMRFAMERARNVTPAASTLARPPAPQQPPKPAAPPAPGAPAPTHMRAAPIPGFENAPPIDVPVTGKPN